MNISVFASKWRAINGLWLFVGSTCLILIALTAHETAWSYSQVQLQSQHEARNLARSLAQQGEALVLSADRLMSSLGAMLDLEGRDAASLSRLEGAMQQRIASNLQLHSIALFDERGDSIASSEPRQTPNLNIANTPNFKRISGDAHAAGSMVGLAMRANLDHAFVLPVYRRLVHQDGSFAGVLVCAIRADVLQELYALLDFGGYQLIQLSTTDGHILLQEPQNASLIGEDFSASPLFQQISGPELETPIHFTSLYDGHDRVGTNVRLAHFNLALLVAFDHLDLLSKWAQHVAIEVLIMALVCAALITAAVFMARQIQAREHSEAEYRLLAHNALDIVLHLDDTGRGLYVSPSFWLKTGWPEQPIGSSPQSHYIFEEDAFIFAAARERVLAGEAIDPIRYRYRLANGGVMWVEALFKTVPAAAGERCEFICNIRDVSKKVQVEDALSQVHEQLMQLSLSDPLTGIGNRRAFDQMLEPECRRAARSKQPLCLLMIDVDYFKRYNDYYGHVAGDKCLRAVASVLTKNFRRASDFVTRYGGEEFAVFLVNTPIDNAMTLSERILSQLAACALPHAEHPLGYVTISVGVACLAPGDHMDRRSLVQKAEEALHQAKAQGRNRAVQAVVPVDMLMDASETR